MTRELPANVRRFLALYRAAMEETGVFITACGCCNSPFPTTFEQEAQDWSRVEDRATRDSLIAHLEEEFK